MRQLKLMELKKSFDSNIYKNEDEINKLTSI